MTQAELDRRVIVFLIGAFVLMFLIVAFGNNKYQHEKEVIHTTDTIRLMQQRIDTLVLKQVKQERIYETKIDTIYMLDSAGVTREYARAIKELDSLSKSGFFNQR